MTYGPSQIRDPTSLLTFYSRDGSTSNVRWPRTPSFDSTQCLSGVNSTDTSTYTSVLDERLESVTPTMSDGISGREKVSPKERVRSTVRLDGRGDTRVDLCTEWPKRQWNIHVYSWDKECETPVLSHSTPCDSNLFPFMPRPIYKYFRTKKKDSCLQFILYMWLMLVNK